MKKRDSMTLLAAAALMAAAPHSDAKRYQKLLGDELEQVANDVIQVEGTWRYVTAGRTGDPTTGWSDFYLSQHRHNSALLFEGRYGGDGEDEGQSVVETADGSYVIAGQTRTDHNLGMRIGVVKTDPSGAMIWESAYSGSAFTSVYNPIDPYLQPPQVRVIEALDGNYIIVGSSVVGDGNQAGVIMKLRASDGAIIYHHTLMLSGQEAERTWLTLTDVRDTEEGPVACGYMYRPSSGGYQDPPGDRTNYDEMANPFLGPDADWDAVVARFSPDGVPIGLRSYGKDDRQEAAYGMDIDPSTGNIVLLVADNLERTDLVWLTPSFDVNEARTHERVVPSLHAIDAHGDAGEIVFAGRRIHSSTGPGNGAVFSINSARDVEWAFRYGPSGSEWDRLEAVMKFDNACGYMAVGDQSGPGSLGGNDIHLVKLNEDGKSGCEQVRSSRASNEPTPIGSRDYLLSYFSSDFRASWASQRDLDLTRTNICFYRRCAPFAVADVTSSGSTLPGTVGYREPDGIVDLDDLGVFLGDWMVSDSAADMTTTGATLDGQIGFDEPDGKVDDSDLGLFLHAWLTFAE